MDRFYCSERIKEMIQSTEAELFQLRMQAKVIKQCASASASASYAPDACMHPLLFVGRKWD